jgi:transposase
VAERFTVEVHERTIGKWLRKLKLTRLQPRPVRPKKDPDGEVAFKGGVFLPSQSGLA